MNNKSISLGDMDTQLRQGCDGQALSDIRTISSNTLLLITGDCIDDYKIVHQLGSGGMGQVYLAENRQSGESLALKVLLPELAQNSGFIARFKKEIKILLELYHENIVKVIDHGYDEAKHFYYYVMEFISSSDNISLDLKRFMSIKNISLKQKEKIVLQICSALDYAHNFRKGCVIHKDLKPSNIPLFPQ